MLHARIFRGRRPLRHCPQKLLRPMTKHLFRLWHLFNQLVATLRHITQQTSSVSASRLSLFVLATHILWPRKVEMNGSLTTDLKRQRRLRPRLFVFADRRGNQPTQFFGDSSHDLHRRRPNYTPNFHHMPSHIRRDPIFPHFHRRSMAGDVQFFR